MPLILQDTPGLMEYLPAADTLPPPDSIAPAAHTLPAAQVWDAAAVYGDESVRIVQEAAETAAGLGPLAENGWFQILAVAVLALWCWMIYYFRGQAAMCLKNLVNFKTEDKFTAEHGHLYNGFVNFAVGITVAAVGIMTVKTVPAMVGVQFIAALPGWFVPPAAVIVAAVAAGIIFLQFGMLQLIGKLTFSENMTGALIQTKKLYLAAAAILVVPPIILYTGLNPVWDTLLGYIIIAETVALTAAFAVKTCILFMGQKVSLLVWILYLCAVEIFPVSLVVLLVMKNV